MSNSDSDYPLGKFKLARSCAISLSNNPEYVLHFVRHAKECQFGVAVSGSNQIKIYNEETFLLQKTLIGHENTITGLLYDKNDPDTLWSTSLDGSLRYWLTHGESWYGYIADKSSIGISCFDINSDGCLLVTGSEKLEDSDTVESTVEVKAWDISNPKSVTCMSCFDSIHSDDVTKVVFHPTNPKIVATASLDGLIVILDISITDENNVIQHTLNTELSVDTFGFFGPSNEFLFALTSNEGMQLWHYPEGEQLSNLGCLREKLSSKHPIDYVIDCFFHSTMKRLFVIAGYFSGKIEIFHLNLDKMELYQTLRGGHSKMIRCVKFLENSFYTGGEDGMLCCWLALPESNTVQVKPDISKMSIRSKREKPYKKKKKKEKESMN